MMWVKLTLAPVVRASWLLRIEPVDLEQAGRHRPHAGRRRHGQAGLHVGHDPRGRTAQRGGLLVPRLHGGAGAGAAAGRPAAAPALGGSLGGGAAESAGGWGCGAGTGAGR